MPLGPCFTVYPGCDGGWKTNPKELANPDPLFAILLTGSKTPPNRASRKPILSQI